MKRSRYLGNRPAALPYNTATIVAFLLALGLNAGAGAMPTEGKEHSQPRQESESSLQAVSGAAGQVKTGKIEGEEWIAAQPQSSFTLQLLATSQHQGVAGLVARHPELKGPLASFEQRRGGRQLYILIQGSYPSRAQAQAAALALPHGVQHWVRDFGGIQEAMRQAAEVVKQPVSLDEAEIRDTAWVWSQNPIHFTIQLTGARQEAAAETMMHDLPFSGELAVVETVRDGGSWYALIYNHFTSREAAEEHAAHLSLRSGMGAPWIRRFSAVQDAMIETGPAR